MVFKITSLAQIAMPVADTAKVEHAKRRLAVIASSATSDECADTLRAPTHLSLAHVPLNVRLAAIATLDRLDGSSMSLRSGGFFQPVYFKVYKRA